jgi:tetratricopeptide (TPR) repeat protein
VGGGSAHLADETVAAFVDGRLAGVERSHAEAHIDACPRCRELISALAAAAGEWPSSEGLAATKIEADGSLDDDAGPPSEEPASEDPQDRGSRLTVGQVVAGRFAVESHAGRGGMAHVHRARDLQTGGVVALKTLHVSDPSLARRFEREARVLEELRSPEVVRYVARGTTADGHAWLAMEWLEGEDLSVRLARSPLGVAETLTLMRRIASGLAAAHARGIVHRDVKPSNVLLRDGEVAQAVLIDFGIARAPRAGTAATRRNTFLGTPGYMAPEQARGGGVLDPRADVFSLACVAYQAVTGTRPFAGGDFLETVARVLLETPPPASTRAPEVPPELDALLARMLSKDPGDRPADGAAVLAALDELSDRGPTHASRARAGGKRRRAFAFLAAGLLATAVAAAALVGKARLHRHEVDAGVTVAPAEATSGNPIVLVLGIENHTVHVEINGTADELFAAPFYTSNVLDAEAGSYLRERLAGVDPDVGRIDEAAARKLADGEHRRVLVVRGAIDNRGGGYEIALSARDVTSGATLLQTHDSAPDAAGLVRVLSDRACELRRQLGDEDPTCSSRMSPSLDADREFTLAAALGNTGQFRESIAHAARAVELDPSFAKARLVLASSLKDIGQHEESLRQFEALAPQLDTMSERARLIIRLDTAALRGDYEEVVQRASAQLAVTPDVAGVEARLGNAYAELGRWAEAQAVGERSARKHPQTAVVRANLLIYELGGGDLLAARRDGEAMLRELRVVPDDAYVVLAIADVLLDDEAGTARILEALDKQSPILGAALAADLAAAHGKGSQAIDRLEQAIGRNGKDDDPEERASALSLLAELKLRGGDAAGALAALQQASASENEHTLFTMARVYLAAGRPREAANIARALHLRSAPIARMAGECVEAEVAAAKGNRKAQLEHARGAVALHDGWIARLELGLAQLESGDLAAARATLQSCEDRRSEGALPFDDLFSDVRDLRRLPSLLLRAQPPTTAVVAR